MNYAVEIANAAGQDRAAVYVRPGGLVIALADGAGGTVGGGRAALAVIEAVGASPTADFAALLEALDVQQRGRGLTTAIVLAVTAAGIAGCGAGDSGAWLVGDEITDLCEGMPTKPFVGEGCFPFAIEAGPLGALTLLVASDGLFKYAPRRHIARIARWPDLALAARALVDLARLPSGGLSDDVAVVLCRAG